MENHTPLDKLATVLGLGLLVISKIAIWTMMVTVALASLVGIYYFFRIAVVIFNH